MPLKAGDKVEGYPYLWLRQRDAGETEGRKARPVCVAVASADAVGQSHLALLPISSQRPAATQSAIKIPQLERKRLGLHGDRPAWVYLGEYNYDIAERSFHLTRQPGQRQA